MEGKAKEAACECRSHRLDSAGEDTHTHTLRILDSYQGESEIRKLKSLFPLSHSACFLSKQTAGSSRAFRSPL